MGALVTNLFESYDEVKNFFTTNIAQRTRKKNVLRIAFGDNTWLCKYQDKSFKMVYHDTAIVAWFSDGSIRLNTGGFFTRTTKARMNSFLPRGFSVFQRSEKWFLYAEWMAEAMRSGGIADKQIRKTTSKYWDLTKQFNEGGECFISAQEMLLYALGKVQA
jgi:hypothetical protein